MSAGQRAWNRSCNAFKNLVHGTKGNRADSNDQPLPLSPCKKTGKAQSYCVLPPPCDYLLMISPQSHVFSMIDEQQRRRYALAVGVKN